MRADDLAQKTNTTAQRTPIRWNDSILQRIAVTNTTPNYAPPIVHEVLREPGRPLPPTTRTFMEPNFHHDFSQVQVHTGAPKRIQAKLIVNQPGDKYEQEAERVAEQIMRQPQPELSLNNKFTTKKSGEYSTCLHQNAYTQRQVRERKEAKTIQRRANAIGVSDINLGLSNQIRNSQGKGQALDTRTLSFMESRFGMGFDNVRIHTDSEAEQMSRSLQARAFTCGSDIYFNREEYNPQSREGQHLLAHELTHVIQQTGNSETSKDVVGYRIQQPAVQRSLSEIRNVPSSDVGINRELHDIHAIANTFLRDRRIIASDNIQQLVRLRNRYAGRGGTANFSEQQANSLRRLFQQMRSVLPGWINVPTLNFGSGPTVSVHRAAMASGILTLGAVITIPIWVIDALIILLIIALAIAIIALFANDEPNAETQEEVDRLTEEMLRNTREQRRRAEPRPDQRPRPTPENRPRPPYLPDVDPDIEEEDERGCTYTVIGQQFGRYYCHARFAQALSGVPREVLVSPPRGEPKSFDAIDHGGTLYEVKTGYRWVVFNPNHPGRDEVIDRFRRQAREQLDVARQCGKPLKWYFNESPVRNFFDERIEPETVYRSFRCNVDSDEYFYDERRQSGIEE